MTQIRMFHLMLPLAMFVAVASPAAADDVVLSDQVLPEETYLHFTVKSVENAKRQFDESPYGQMINDPAMAEFRGQVVAAIQQQLSDYVADMESRLGLSVHEILSIPSGEVSVSIAGAGNHVGLVMHVDFGDSGSQVESLLELAEQALGQVEQLRQSKEEFDGTEITLYEAQEDVPTPLLREFGWFVRDSHLVVCSSQQVMESLISNWDGSATDSFSHNETYFQTLNRLETEPGSADSIFYFDLIGLLTKLSQTASFGEGQFVASMAIAQLPMLGLNQLHAIAMVTEEGTGDFQIVNRAMVYSEQPPKSLMRAFVLDTVNAAPPAWVKEDAVLYLAAKWQVSEAYAAIETLVDRFNGPGTLAKYIDQISASGPGIHIKDELIDQLTGEVQMVGGGLDSATGVNEMLFAVGVRDSAAFSDLLARVSDEPEFPGEIREFRGFTLYEISQGGPVVGLTVANGSFLIAIGERIMEQVLRNDDDILPLAESADFKRIARHFPSEVVGVNFARPADQYRSLYELLQSGDAADNFPGMDEFFANIDFTTLPPFETISKYLAPTGGFTVADENGYVSEGFSLRP